MIYPVQKHFRIIRGVLFDYSFQYLMGSSTAGVRVDLTGYSALWTITWTTQGGGITTYTTGGAPNTSGVFFGGPSQTPTNGFIDLTIAPVDTTAIPWAYASYTLDLTPPAAGGYRLLKGGMGIVLG